MGDHGAARQDLPARRSNCVGETRRHVDIASEKSFIFRTFHIKDTHSMRSFTP